MKILNDNTPDKPHYKFENTMYLGDDFGNQGRLSFEVDLFTIKKFICLFKCNPNTPKKKMKIETISFDNPLHPGSEGMKAITEFKTAKKVKTHIDDTFDANAFHLPLFIETLKKTEIKFLYESRQYIEEQAALRQEKEPLFTPKPKNYDRSKSTFKRRNRKFGE